MRRWPTAADDPASNNSTRDTASPTARSPSTARCLRRVRSLANAAPRSTSPSARRSNGCPTVEVEAADDSDATVKLTQLLHNGAQSRSGSRSRPTRTTQRHRRTAAPPTPSTQTRVPPAQSLAVFAAPPLSRVVAFSQPAIIREPYPNAAGRHRPRANLRIGHRRRLAPHRAGRAAAAGRHRRAARPATGRPQRRRRAAPRRDRRPARRRGPARHRPHVPQHRRRQPRPRLGRHAAARRRRKSTEAGYRIVNLDCVVHAERPKLRRLPGRHPPPHRRHPPPQPAPNRPESQNRRRRRPRRPRRSHRSPLRRTVGNDLAATLLTASTKLAIGDVAS